MPSPRLLSAALFTTIALSACTSVGGSPWVELKGKRFNIEIADDDAERARGLMFRESMEDDHAMLFIHDTEEPQAYWMKNTKIPLDILYFDHQRKLVSAQQGVPPCSAGDSCPPYPSEGSALYVLELNAGTMNSLGAKVGDELKFSPDIATKK
ncbi:MAG TPA: DUF192 domain-containing protein [Arenimonas sp.]|uniref:DUF192 domain-containing protein n=1 Tax=Arenimonas sp. TaxID=1872635 RepID=UPI002C22AD44|nr:DUF192 domain-containing protein [Arenimonas sp.]HMB56058.1 DUF192 domain-containing protein [Arenimonas sp.]